MYFKRKAYNKLIKWKENFFKIAGRNRNYVV